MRCNIAIYGLWAYSMGLLVAGDPDADNPRPFDTLSITLDGSPIIDQNQNRPFSYFPHHVKNVTTVSLKLYGGGISGNGNNDSVIANTTISQLSNPNNFIQLILPSRQFIIKWSQIPPNKPYIEMPLYIESGWVNKSTSGNSTSPLFAVYNSGDSTNARKALEGARTGAADDDGLPAYNETAQSPILSPSPSPSESVSQSQSQSPTIPTQALTTTASTTSVTSTPLITTTTTQTPTNVGLISSSSHRAGLSRAGVIGIAVGVSVGGLLIAGALLWLFWLRRRRSKNSPRHAMAGYDSDTDAHAIVTDKEIPALLETPAPGSAYGGEGRPSTDHYAPYSDRPIASPVPTPQRHRAASPDAAEAPTTSQTDLTWSREAQTPTPVPAIASRYAHLIEEGMTEEDVRRVEEEERQLDAAIEKIENVGRRRNS
ncbi:hypothetical protein GGR51DRAFT_265568 [Nemania sp. FL0031]|nr:hypothetical protein GGR51DRAFT_265568 [Nemania sp. FL0031]